LAEDRRVFTAHFFNNYLILLCYKNGVPQKGQPESCRSRTLAMV
jgi:hypothetical protein